MNLLNNLKKIGFFFISAFATLLFFINRSLKKNNNDLKLQSQNNLKVIKIQKKVLDIDETNKYSDLSSIIKRMQDKKL